MTSWPNEIVLNLSCFDDSSPLVFIRQKCVCSNLKSHTLSIKMSFSHKKHKKPCFNHGPFQRQVCEACSYSNERVLWYSWDSIVASMSCTMGDLIVLELHAVGLHAELWNLLVGAESAECTTIPFQIDYQWEDQTWCLNASNVARFCLFHHSFRIQWPPIMNPMIGTRGTQRSLFTNQPSVNKAICNLTRVL